MRTVRQKSIRNISSSHARDKEVRMKKPLFFEVVAEILKPTELVPTFRSSKEFVGRNFSFVTKPSRLRRREKEGSWKSSWRGMYSEHIIFRFCRMDSSKEQEDHFPSGLNVQLNQHHLALPPCAAPLDVTEHALKSSCVANRVTVAWKAHDPSTSKVGMTICVAKKIPLEQVLRKILLRAPLREEETSKMIRKLLDGEADCKITDTLRTSLLCPLRLALLRIPIRSRHCSHLRCFDAAAYLSLNERRASWRCPLCGVPAPFEALIVDEFFRKVLASSRLKGALEIEIHEDGSWTPVKPDHDENI